MRSKLGLLFGRVLLSGAGLVAGTGLHGLVNNGRTNAGFFALAFLLVLGEGCFSFGRWTAGERVQFGRLAVELVLFVLSFGFLVAAIYGGIYRG